MALSARAYARHRGVSHTAVQKALRAGRITALPDGTINAEAADRDWNATTEVRRAAEQVPADPTRVGLPAGSLATAEATVRAVLVEHGARTAKALTLADVRLASEILRARQRADAIIAAQRREARLQQREDAAEGVDPHIVSTLIGNLVSVLMQYLDPRDVQPALDKVRALQERYVPGTAAAEASLSPVELSGALQRRDELQAALPLSQPYCAPYQAGPDERPTDRLPEGDGAGAEDGRTPVHRPPLDKPPTGDWGQSTSGGEQVVDSRPEPSDRDMVADSGLQCGTCVNMRSDGWCRQRRFFVSRALRACDIYYEPMPANQSGQ
jgi:hypothetical protein